MRYLVRLPVTGYLVHAVDAENEDAAVEAVMNNEADSSWYDVDVETDSNLAQVFARLTNQKS